jgi:vitamin-K-epoxide reductase (warfarin-sensitive)
MILVIQLLAGAGFLVSLYALNVRNKLQQSTSYTPICDISEHISCSKAFGSDYSKTMGIPNPLTGMLFYFMLIILPFSKVSLIFLFYLTVPAGLFSLYLGYISFIKQRNFCLVCTFTYLLNFALIIASTRYI